MTELYRWFGLRPAPSYLGARYHDPAERAPILERARQQIDWTVALGMTELFVSDSCFPERFAVAGHETADQADQLPDDGYRGMADVLNEVAGSAASTACGPAITTTPAPTSRRATSSTGCSG